MPPAFTDKDISAKPKRGPAANESAAPAAPVDKSSDFNPKEYTGHFSTAMISAVSVDIKELPLTKEATSCQPLAKLDAINASILKLRPQGR